MLIINPSILIILIYVLIFVIRPVFILYYDALTLDYEVVTLGDWYWAMAFSAVSLISILSFSLVFCRRRNIIDQPSSGPNLRSVSPKHAVLFLVMTIISASTLLIYGSALSNTSDRLMNPGGYTFYSLFAILSKIQQGFAVYFFTYYLNPIFRKSSIMLFLLIVSPVLALFVSGRGAMLYMFLSFIVVLLAYNRVRLNLKNAIYGFLLFLVLLYSSVILSSLRILMSTSSMTVIEILWDLISGQEYLPFKQVLMDATWDYSVFDSFVRLLNNYESYKIGFTNVSYILSYIPRAMWIDKPYDQGFGLAFTSTFYSDIFSSNGSTFAATIVGEGFWNFSVFGVVFYSGLFGLFIFKLYSSCLRSGTIFSIAIYAIALPLCFSIIRGGTDFMIQFLLFTFIPIFIIDRMVLSAPRYGKR